MALALLVLQAQHFFPAHMQDDARKDLGFGKEQWDTRGAFVLLGVCVEGESLLQCIGQRQTVQGHAINT